MRTAAMILALSCMAVAPAQAEKVYAGSKGGFWCREEEDLLGVVAGRFKGRKDGLGPSCETIRPFSQIDAKTVVKIDELTAAGQGDTETANGVRFIVFRDKLPPTDRTFKRVSPNDVRNTPTKWKGRPIEFANVNVYWVGDDDVRILTGTNVTLFATKIRSADRGHFSNGCETEDEAMSRKCKATVRFVYQDHDEDQPNGLFKRIVLTSDDVELIRAPAGRR